MAVYEPVICGMSFSPRGVAVGLSIRGIAVAVKHNARL